MAVRQRPTTTKGAGPASLSAGDLQNLTPGAAVYIVTYVSPITNEREAVPTLFESADEAIAECISIINDGDDAGEESQPALIPVLIRPL